MTRVSSSDAMENVAETPVEFEVGGREVCGASSGNLREVGEVPRFHIALCIGDSKRVGFENENQMAKRIRDLLIIFGCGPIVEQIDNAFAVAPGAGARVDIEQGAIGGKLLQEKFVGLDGGILGD